MTRDYHITVCFDGQQLTIAEEYRKLELTTDISSIHSVVWMFEGIEAKVAAGWLPRIEFEVMPPSGNSYYSGPFLCLGTTPSRVIASGNTGVASDFTYRAVLEPPPEMVTGNPSEPPIRSAEAVITNAMTEEKPAAIQVHHQGEGQLLEVEPREVTLIAGQQMTWEVVGTPSNMSQWYPRLLFTNAENPFLGPFSSLAVNNSTLVATGSGKEVRVYNYLFQLVDLVDGQPIVESSPDPTIDDEGDPPTTTNTDLEPAT